MESGPRITMITVYDYPTARAFDQCGFDYFLVGDSVGMVELGLKDTKTVTIDMILHHLRAVKRGTESTHIVGDMPINSYSDKARALETARMFLGEGADSVKLEGAVLDVVGALTGHDIQVISHIGLTPQTASDFRQRGTDPAEAEMLKQDALSLQEAGCCAIILEHIPSVLSREITEALDIPTIGIGAGPFCSGQVLVSADILGLSDRLPPFAKKYADLKKEMIEAGNLFINEVKNGHFPSEEYYR